MEGNQIAKELGDREGYAKAHEDWLTNKIDAALNRAYDAGWQLGYEAALEDKEDTWVTIHQQGTTTLTTRREGENMGKTRASKRLEKQIAESAHMQGVELDPEHEEARRLTERLRARPSRLTDDQWKAAGELLALLAKAEQERDELAETAKEYWQTVMDKSKRAHDAERELERLRAIIARFDEEARLRKSRFRDTDPDEVGFA